MNTNYSAILAEYIAWLDTLGYSDDIIDCGKISVRAFFEWLENKQINSINLLNSKHISDYFFHLETRPNKVFKGKLLSNAHLNKNYFSIDKLLEFLHNYGLKNVPIPTNKRIKMDNQERIQKIETFTQDEIKTLYACISNTYLTETFAERQGKHYELKLIFTLCYGCGLRKSEAYNLRIQDVDFEKKTVFVKQGKNYKDRIVPMSTSVYRDLQDYIYNFRHKLKLNHNRLVFSCDQMVRLRLKQLQKVCENEQIKAKRITTHILRHSIATHLLQNGMNIENIALFLGHSSLDSTQIYTHIVNQF
jgi:integrase/recombinase XerD